MCLSDEEERRLQRQRDAREMWAVAERIAGVVYGMDDLAAVGWSGPAASEFACSLEQLREQLVRAYLLLDRAGDALTGANP